MSINLTEGTHTIEWSLEGYETLAAVINISSTGAISCVSVNGGVCTSAVNLLGNSITGNLKSLVIEGVCGWIDNLGTPDSIITFNIMDLVQGYLGLKDLGFPVTTSLIMGAVAYYNGQIASGNSLTGCGFT